MADKPLHSARPDQVVCSHSRNANRSPMAIVAPNFAVTRATIAEGENSSIMNRASVQKVKPMDYSPRK